MDERGKDKVEKRSENRKSNFFEKGGQRPLNILPNYKIQYTHSNTSLERMPSNLFLTINFLVQLPEEPKSPNADFRPTINQKKSQVHFFSSKPRLM